MKERQLEIIEATGRILTSSGVKGLTIKNLAKEMKFTESAIYRHFKGKEEIILSLLNYLANSMDERLAGAIQQANNPDDKLKILFECQFEFFENNPHFVVAVFSDGLMEESININAAIHKIMSVKMKHLKRIITEGQEKSFFTEAITTDDLIHIVMGSFRLLMYKWRVANFKFEISKSGNHLLQSILNLIKKQI